MKTAQEYAVTFGYNATNPIGNGKYQYYGPRSQTVDYVGDVHRGNDRPCPANTPVIICGIQIGTTGRTGAAGGNHLHTQAWSNSPANTVDPTPYEFQPGRVVTTGWADQWGNFVTILVGDKNVTYAHLNTINVSAGLVIKAEEKKDVNVMDKDAVRFYYLDAMDVEPTPEQLAYWLGRPPRELGYALYKTSELRRYKANNYAALEAGLNAQKQTVVDLNKQVERVMADDVADKQKISEGLARIATLSDQLLTMQGSIEQAISTAEKTAPAATKSSWFVKLIAGLNRSK